MRRVVDLLLATPALIGLAPLIAALGLAVRLESPGGALFRQVRVGRDGAPFVMLKLRTMRATAPGAATVMGGRADPRVTRVGSLLRRTHLDELPQLVNVVRGEMTLIGPRPEIPEFVARYTPAQRDVLRVRPGITGPGQIEYARRWEPLLDGADDPNRVYLEQVMGPKLELDLAYLRERSVAGDLRIVRQTLGKVLRAARDRG
jgi:lipopolysaccharide/colanic/teichoic acid biosynthesis glycosyltransferase